MRPFLLIIRIVLSFCLCNYLKWEIDYNISVQSYLSIVRTCSFNGTTLNRNILSIQRMTSFLQGLG